MPIKSIQVSLLKAMEESQVRSMNVATTQALAKGTLVDPTSGVTDQSIEVGD